MRFLSVISTKTARGYVTYAQKFYWSVVTHTAKGKPRYQSHSDSKSLIYIALSNCFLKWQSGESLDLQGLQGGRGNLSTKLSTETVGYCKAHVNQALRAISTCSSEEVRTISYGFGAC
jgi:hypothetical protein